MATPDATSRGEFVRDFKSERYRLAPDDLAPAAQASLDKVGVDRDALIDISGVSGDRDRVISGETEMTMLFDRILRAGQAHGASAADLAAAVRAARAEIVRQYSEARGYPDPITVRDTPPPPEDLTPGIHVHPHPDMPDRLVWIRMTDDGIHEAGTFAFLDESRERALAQAGGDERLADRLVTAAKHFNDYIQDSILVGKTPWSAYEVWMSFNAGEAVANGFFFGGDPATMQDDEPSWLLTAASLLPTFLGVFRSLRTSKPRRVPGPRTHDEQPRVNRDGSQLPDRNGLFDNLVARDRPKPVDYGILEERGGTYYLRRGDAVEPVPEGTYQFVTMPNGQIRVAKEFHVDLSGDSRVRMAGEVSFRARMDDQGADLRRWSNASGHYRPIGTHAQNAGLPVEAFEDISRIFAFFRNSKIYKRSKIQP